MPPHVGVTHPPARFLAAGGVAHSLDELRQLTSLGALPSEDQLTPSPEPMPALNDGTTAAEAGPSGEISAGSRSLCPVLSSSKHPLTLRAL